MINLINKNQIYKILKKHASYFLKQEEILQSGNEINIYLSDYSCQNFKDEEIRGFIEYLTNGEPKLTYKNALSLKNLSHEFHIISLENSVDEFININYRKIIENIFSSLKNPRNKTILNIFVEKLISHHISEFIDHEILQTFPICVLYRILGDYTKNNNKIQAEVECKIIDFIIKVTKYKGISGSILFNTVKLSNDGIEYLLEKVYDEQEQIDINFNIIQPLIVEYLHYKKEEYKSKERKIKNEYEQKISELRNEKARENNDMIEYINRQIAEMKESYDEKIAKIQSSCDEKIAKIQSSCDEKIANIQASCDEKNNDMKTRYDEKIEEILIKNQQENDEINSIIKSETSTNLLIIRALIDSHEKYLKIFWDLLTFLSNENAQSDKPIRILDSIFIPNIKISLLEFILQPQKLPSFKNQIGFHSNLTEMLYSNDSFDFKKFYSNFNFSTFVFELHRSSTSFESIFEKISQNKNEKIQLKIIFDGPKVQKIPNNKEIIDLIDLEQTINIINEDDFADYSSIKQIMIPPTVTQISKRSFKGCKSLEFISIPNTITTIEQESFSGCSKLKNISIPESIKTLKNGCFSECSSLTQISIPSSVTSIGKNVFANCTSISKITIPSSVTKISKGLFKGCKSLEFISIPNTITSLAEESFSGCSKLKNISIPESVTSIGNSSFAECTSLLSIDIPSSITNIGIRAFFKCSSLTHIFIPSSVNVIGDNAFEQYNSIKFIGISNVFSIDKLGIQPNVDVFNDDDYSEILFNLGIKLKKCQSISKNKNEAAKFFKMAAEKGNEKAMLHYGAMLYIGDGISRDTKEAARYFKMSAERGNEYAMFNYAVMLRYGDGVTMDRNEEEKYFNELKKIGKFNELRKLSRNRDTSSLHKFLRSEQVLTDFE